MKKIMCFFPLFFSMAADVMAQQMTVWSGGVEVYSGSTVQIDSVTFRHGESRYVVNPNMTGSRNSVAGQTYANYYKPKTGGSSSQVEPVYPLYYLYFYDDKSGCLVHYGTNCGVSDQFVDEFTYELEYPKIVLTTAEGDSLRGSVAGGSGLLLQIEGRHFPFVSAAPVR